MADDLDLMKVYLDLPNHWLSSGESIWARHLRENFYEIDNSPFLAYGLNYRDVVEAETDDASAKPVVKKIVSRSGHRTLRVIFPKDIPPDQCDPVLASLVAIGATYEGMEGYYFSVDVSPSTNYEVVIALLEKLEKTEIISYETCEERVTGSFDDEPGTNH